METLLASKERLKTGFLPLEQTTLIKVHLQQRLPLKVLLEFLVQLCDSHLYNNRFGKDNTHMLVDNLLTVSSASLKWKLICSWRCSIPLKSTSICAITPYNSLNMLVSTITYKSLADAYCSISALHFSTRSGSSD